MKSLSKKQWIGVGVAVVVIIIFFNKPFFSFFTGAGSLTPTNQYMDNQGQNSQEPVTPPSPTTPVTNSNPRAGQVFVTELAVGTGEEVKVGSLVSVNYIGTFENGVKFDSSYDSGRLLEFEVGSRQLIPGFDAGVVGMKVGGKRQLTIPPEFAYGAEGRPPVIPPNSTLIFTIEVMDVK